MSGPPPQLYQPEFQQEVAKKLHQQQLEQQQKLIEQQQQQQKLLEQQKQQQQLQQQQQQNSHQPMDQVQYQQQPDQLVYQQPDQVQYHQQQQPIQQQTYSQVVQNVDNQQYQPVQSQNAQAGPVQYQNKVDQAAPQYQQTVEQAQVKYHQNVEQAKVQYQQSVEQTPVQYQQSGQAHIINHQQSADQAQMVYQQAVDHAKNQYQQSVDQAQIIYQAVDPGVQQLPYPSNNQVQVQQFTQEGQVYQPPAQQPPQMQHQQVQPAGQATHQPVIQPPAHPAQQYQQQQLHLVPLQQVGDTLQGLSCIQQVQPVHEMITEEQTGQLTLMMSGVHGVEARVMESEELVRAVEEQPHSQIMQEPIHPMVKKIQEIQSMSVVQNMETGFDASPPVVDPKSLAVDVPGLTSGGSYLSPGSVGASGTSGYNSQQSTVTSDLGGSVDQTAKMPVNTVAGQERDKVSCVSSEFERSACPPTALRPALKLDTTAGSTDRPLLCSVEDPSPSHPYPTTMPGWVTAPIIFTTDIDGRIGRESRRGSLPVAQAGTSLLFPQSILTKAHSAETSPKYLSTSSYSSLSLKLPFPSQSLRRRSADPSDLYRSRQSHRHISGSTSPTSVDELLALPLLEQRRASGGSAALSPLWEQLPGHGCLLMSCPHSNCSSQSNMSNMLTIREVMSMTSSQTSLASTQVLKLHTGRRHPTICALPALTPPSPPLTLHPAHPLHASIYIFYSFVL